MNQTITLPREVAAAIAQILIDAKTGECDYQDGRVKWSIDQLAAALEQPQRKLTSQEIADSALLGNIESQFNACMHQEHCKRWKAQAGLQHQHESRHINDLATKTSHSVTTCSTVPEGWKMVPVEPTIAMLCDAVMEWEGQAVYKVMSASGLRKLEEQAADGYRAMLAAAPQPPTVKECLTVEQPQGEQEPVAEGDMVDPVSVPRGLLGAACFAIDHKRDAPKLLEKLRRYTVGDLSGNAAPQPPATPGEPSVVKVIGTDERGPMLLWHRAWTDFPNGTQLYTSPQPKREPLTDEKIERTWQFLHDEEGNPPDQHDFARAIIAEYEGAHKTGSEA